jgi:hypothetical protein
MHIMDKYKKLDRSRGRHLYYKYKVYIKILEFIFLLSMSL